MTIKVYLHTTVTSATVPSFHRQNQKYSSVNVKAVVHSRPARDGVGVNNAVAVSARLPVDDIFRVSRPRFCRGQ